MTSEDNRSIKYPEDTSKRILDLYSLILLLLSTDNCGKNLGNGLYECDVCYVEETATLIEGLHNPNTRTVV